MIHFAFKNPPDPKVLAELAIKAHKTAIEKGWWGPQTDPHIAMNQGPPLISTRNFKELMALATSELMEAFEIARMPDFDPRKIWLNGQKPEGFPTELADCVIRLFDDLASARIDCEKAFQYAFHNYHANLLLSEIMAEEGPQSYRPPSNIGAQIMEVIEDLSVLSKKPQALPIAGEIIFNIFAIAEMHGGTNLIEAIRQKMEYNSTRPFRHGNKRA